MYVSFIDFFISIFHKFKHCIFTPCKRCKFTRIILWYHHRTWVTCEFNSLTAQSTPRIQLYQTHYCLGTLIILRDRKFAMYQTGKNPFLPHPEWHECTDSCSWNESTSAAVYQLLHKTNVCPHWHTSLCQPGTLPSFPVSTLFPGKLAWKCLLQQFAWAEWQWYCNTSDLWHTHPRCIEELVWFYHYL